MDTKILHKEICYQFQGAVFTIRNEYGSGHKESVYRNLLLEILTAKGLSVCKEKQIPVYSHSSGEKIGCYQPDLILEEKVIVELKTARWTTQENINQLLFYLKNTSYEVGYLINFGSPSLYMKRFIFTNNRKPFRANS